MFLIKDKNIYKIVNLEFVNSHYIRTFIMKLVVRYHICTLYKFEALQWIIIFFLVKLSFHPMKINIKWSSNRIQHFTSLYFVK